MKKPLLDRVRGDLDRGDLALARRRLESRLQIEPAPAEASAPAAQ